MLNTNEIIEDAEFAALEYRSKYNLGLKGIKNIFSFAENTLGYLLIRYPFGEENLQGFSSIHNGERLVVTNSSLILSRESFTVAHEIGHHYFDLSLEKPQIINDLKTGSFDESNVREFRADNFAASFLMPRDGVIKYLREMDKRGGKIDSFDIIKLQLEFGVSYRSVVRRLESLSIINKDQSAILFDYFNHTGMSLSTLFMIANADTSLLEPNNKIQIPPKYYHFVHQNYDNNLISYDIVKKVLANINKNPEELGFELHNQDNEDDIDVDELLEELKDD